MAKAVATAASTALPPALRIETPTSAAGGEAQTTMPLPGFDGRRVDRRPQEMTMIAANETRLRHDEWNTSRRLLRLAATRSSAERSAARVRVLRFAASRRG